MLRPILIRSFSSLPSLYPTYFLIHKRDRFPQISHLTYLYTCSATFAKPPRWFLNLLQKTFQSTVFHFKCSSTTITYYPAERSWPPFSCSQCSHWNEQDAFARCIHQHTLSTSHTLSYSSRLLPWVFFKNRFYKHSCFKHETPLHFYTTMDTFCFKTSNNAENQTTLQSKRKTHRQTTWSKFHWTPPNLLPSEYASGCHVLYLFFQCMV